VEYEIDSEESISQAVVKIVSMLENTAPTDLPVLHDSVDSEALDAIFTGNENYHLSFAYSNSQIEVYNGEYLTVESA